jgi:hypothetical protein
MIATLSDRVRHGAEGEKKELEKFFSSSSQNAHLRATVASGNENREEERLIDDQERDIGSLYLSVPYWSLSHRALTGAALS